MKCNLAQCHEEYILRIATEIKVKLFSIAGQIKAKINSEKHHS